MPRHVLLTTDVVGGVWDFARTLAGGLIDRQQARVTLLTLGQPTPDQREQARRIGAELIAEPLRLEWMQDSDEDVARTRALAERLARDLHVDVVHANQFAAAMIDAEVPVVLTLHSDVLSWRRWTLGATDGPVPEEWQRYAKLVGDALARADRVVAVSHFLAHEVSDLYGAGRPINVIHNAWPSQPAPPPAARAGTLMAGRIWDAAKNVRLAADAAIGWDPGEVLLAGEQRHPDGGTAPVPWPLRPLGFVPYELLQRHMRQARVYLSPARYDPFGLLPLQAALNGCALLLSDIPSYRELWDGAAAFFDANDPDDLRTHWRRVLAEPAELAARARERAVERYAPERMLAEYDSIYAAVREPARA